MGLIAIGDPVFNLSVRDTLIGWDANDRRERLVNVMDAYVLGALPPYNALLGGKMVACLIRTQQIYDEFTRTYGSTSGIISGKAKKARLLSVTTSSSMGRSSVYNRLKLGGMRYFEPIGYTRGWGHFHISDELFAELREYLRSIGHQYADQHRFGQGPNWRLRTTRAALKALGLRDELLRHGIRRQVFVCNLVSNAATLLRTGKGRPDPLIASHSAAGRRPRPRTVDTSPRPPGGPNTVCGTGLIFCNCGTTLSVIQPPHVCVPVIGSKTGSQTSMDRNAAALKDLQDNLFAHFRSLAAVRERSGFPIFALEHGMTPAELQRAQSLLRERQKAKLTSAPFWLLWTVYASEAGYDYTGDEYWPSFDKRTPNWQYHDRPKVKNWFGKFQRSFNGVVPSGPWAEHFSIIAWPITHALLPRYLQRPVRQAAIRPPVTPRLSLARRRLDRPVARRACVPCLDTLPSLPRAGGADRADRRRTSQGRLRRR